MNIRVKNDGTILLPTLIISGMLISLALALTKIVSDELQFSADLLLAERAYFAAESGVEQSLLSLKTSPINYVNIETILPNASITEVFVENSKTEFPFSLPPKTILRWQLGLDTNDEMLVVQKLVKDFEINIDPPATVSDLQWKIQCNNSLVNTTEMLQARASGNLITEISIGGWDNGTDLPVDKNIQDFLSSFLDDDLCFISLTNFGNGNISGKVKSLNGEMAPAQTHVRAIGKAAGREKIIEFEYRQKNLNPFFDFGLLHREN